ncbi:PaPKS1 melanin biosynthesis polyketide synthase encoded by the PaPKS1 protein [Podospora aff. communis PSN243]|uniref:PaPKS1 melanin biosynthesis polyketide synthase encoded by the PaPKS1 protein n=1 Tax=Podospora aff. communis PSN243 TaxID=3040156 RepID=A0AAV9GZ07_9PEZI|nr:PaPKS1 melanin biosynthesis polyketide synthase encoded by the PaPKS1 protein [Podospora aff. communis PSN243]
MADKLAFLLFGDQSLDTHGFLAEFYRQEKQGLLAKAFLEQAGHALRKEVEGLQKLERSRLPIFITLQQLNERYHAQKLKHPGIDGALLCISQLAHYIDHAEKNYEDVTQHGQTQLVGLCSGLFAASAIASTPSLSTLVPVAVQVVLMAFRTGSYVHKLAERLNPSVEQSESWTYIFPGLKPDETASLLKEFHQTNGIPKASHAWVSAASASSIAISGPPSTLKSLVSSGCLSAKPTSIPVYGPYHASHLHSAADIAKILKLDDEAVTDAFVGTRPRSAVMSCTTGTWFTATETKELFKSVVYEILNETLMFNKVLDGCLERAQNTSATSCLILPLGPTQNAATLANLLKNNTDLEVILRKPPGVSAEATASNIGNHGKKGDKCKLAIVGMAGRFPDAASHEKLWELLEKGLDVHRVVPPDRFPVENHYDPTGKAVNTSHTPYGCWIENPGFFDPRFFNMSPREAFQTDPMQRMALTTAYEALEMSGYVPNRTPSTRLDRIGTFYGQTSDDWREINAAQEVDTYFITGGVRAFGPGRINYHLGFSGPSLNVDTACSSSAAAMNVACNSLWVRDCDTAIVGGLSCMTNSDIFAGLSRGQFLSKKGPCATFDNEADGYCRGDGCASVIVKRLEDAEADQDRILAIILGTQTNHSADAISITHPHGPTQSILSRSILDDAGVDPLDVDYVEMHGTGTQAGDGTEMKSVTNVFAPADRKRPADRPLYLGAVKANVGHGEAASGITALCKVLLMLQKNLIPPHVGIKAGSVINKTFPKDLSERNVNIAFHTTPFRRKDGKPRRVFINNFSAAGGNTGLLLEDAPKVPAAKPDPRSHHLITLTGKSKSAMIRNAERLVAWMDKHHETPVSHVAYSTTARKIQHYWRMNVSATDLDDAKKLINDRLKENFVPVSPEQPKVAFMFTGQGSHYASLGKDFYEHYSVFKQSIDEFNHLAQVHGFPSFLPLIDGSEPDVSKLSPVVVQLGLACFEMALARLWASWGIKPSVVLGHSLGEYAALNIAGVLSASDTIYLVGARAQLLVEKCTAGTHAMLATMGSVETVTEALGAKASSVNVACINGPRETVLSGEAAQMAEIAQDLAAAGFKCTQLRVPFAFHSAQVEPILDEFEKLAESVQFNAPQVPIISPLLGKLVEGEAIDAAYLRNHAREAVNFLGGLVSAQQTGTIDEKTVWLEVGPHPVCAGMVKAAFGGATIAVPTVRRNETAYKTLTNTLCTLHSAGLNVDFNEFHRDFASSVRLLDLPSYSFDEKNYWLQYTGDWCLTKNRVASASPKAIEPAKPKLSTTSVQKIVKEEIKGDVCTIEIQSDLHQEQLRNVVTGHLVNGAPLCPSTLYGDMAMTVCDYAYKQLIPGAEKIGCNIAGVEVPKTLIFDETSKSQILTMKVTANAKAGFADIVWSTGEGAKKVEHATSRVTYGNTDEWQNEFDRVAYLIKARIQALEEAERRGDASKIGRGLAYKLFTALVDYNYRFKGMEEVILDSNSCEATAKIKFQTKPEDGTFHFSPFHLDSVCHISGFIINGTDAVDSREQVYISHGWSSLRFTEIPDPAKEYRSYIRMQPVKGTKMYSGDAYVFDGDKVIGIAGDIRFAAVPRKVLNMILPPRGAAAASAGPGPAARAAPAPKAAPAKAVPAAKKKKETVTPANIGKVNQKLKSVVSEVMDILAKEVGCSHDELADNIAFTDLGVDSLMSLTVSGRIREEMDLDLHSNAFVDYPTIGAFKGYLGQFETSGRKESVSSQDSDDDSDNESPEIELESDSNVTTPPDDSETGSIKGDGPSGSNEELRTVIRDTIASEMGMEVDEVTAAPDLANLGMDSLMSLSILGTLREKTGLNIPSDLFVSNPSLKDVERALGIADVPKKVAAAPKPTKTQAPPAPAASKHPRIGLEEPAPPKPPRPTNIVDAYPHRKASSVLLSGSHRTATKHLFMVPDGSGSATSYTEIADVGGEWAVWGLFSPFMKTPDEYKCGVYGMATKFIEEMRRRQPKGPYSVAGWSAGGVIAYEIVNQLVKAGEEVEHLVIIDAPCPVTIEPLPQGLHAWFASIGLLGDGDDKKIPSWLLPHFAASVTALSNYDAEPIPKDKCPKVTAIWCEDGVCKLPTDPRPEPYPKGHALFLLDNRSDFGPNRWDEYLDINKMTFRHMPGNHFSMMHDDLAKQLGGFVREALL